MRILIGADLVPTKSNISLFESGNAEKLLGKELMECLNRADYRIFNLEVPLTDREQPIPKCGPNLVAPSKCVAGYQAMGVDLLTLANNHILDQDQQGLESTVKTLDQAGIAYTGVGSTPEEAAKPYVFTCECKRIGVYACAEHEFSIVTDHSAGANPIDLLESPDHVAKLKEQCDYVIVLYHGGKEHYRYPSPNLQKVCRKLVEKGADLVVCQHSHCIGCEEKYLHGTIVYGQGNFLFDDSESEFWQTGMLVAINDDFKVSYVPITKHQNGVRLAEGVAKEEILNDFYSRSEQLKHPAFVEAEYEKFAISMVNHYLGTFTGTSGRLGFRIMNKLTHGKWIVGLEKRISQKRKLAMQNFVVCEAHREMLVEGLKRV